ncbi:activating signal cointegrator 1 complex subunit [Borealophlyctis nickersoniae]|nr:activating signal cointegrator 1 complex subunit [Borealophlyctis nickersoniae]
MAGGSLKFTDALRGYLAEHEAGEEEHRAATGRGKGKSADADPEPVDLGYRRYASTTFYADWNERLDELKKLLAARKTSGESVAVPEGEEFGADIPFVNPFAKKSAAKSGKPAEVIRMQNVALDDEHAGPPAKPPNLPPRATAVEFDRNWLLTQCDLHIINHAPESAMSATELCTDVFDILRSGKSDDSIQNALVDLLGYANFDLITTLLTNRKTIVETIVSSAIEPPPPAPTAVPVTTTSRPQHGAQVTVMTEAEKLQTKQARKELKRKGRTTQGENNMLESANMLGFDGDYLRRIREDQLQAAANAPLIQDQMLAAAAAPQEKYPHVYQSGSGGSVLSTFGNRFALPMGTQRIDEKDHEEIRIPIPERAPPRAGEKLVDISSLDEYAQRGFKGYKSLNRVQSIVFPIAYETNENMLVCAPTGAGKTDVAMLTVLRTLSQNRHGGRLAKNDFKIVYVAPMKALAAEVVRKFSARLGGREEEGGLGMTVKELTGDMQLTKAEIAATQMIVTTPEKWDVVTRKSVGDTELAQKVRLLIIDEVHLLHDDRGSVIESIVARTLRQVESTQSLIRIVGLSATLPNYVDVAQFLGVNPYQGLFFFDGSFRPVPLAQNFIGVKGKTNSFVMQKKINSVCYDKVVELVREGAQVMVFVHARKETVRTAQMLRDEALNNNELGIFDVSQDPQFGLAQKDVQRSKNKEMKELFASGFGIHHAGMLRGDRTMTERLFEKGLIKVLCCTATLAWGVNLPAYAVVIKGTQLYDANKGGFVDLSILDVLQIFGRAGRPQYETHGVGYIITTHDKLAHYVSAMTQQHPIESRFAENMPDNLNAEISLGTVTNLDEAVKWLSYTYFYVRMRRNPFQYGLDWKEIQEDPLLVKRRRDLIVSAARGLHKAQMIVFDERTGYLTPKDLGRTASSFYIRNASVEVFNEMMRPRMTEADVLSMVSMSTEFENIKVREEEITEMKRMEEESCVCAVRGSVDTNYGKTNILLQSYVSRAHIEDFALVSDTAYVAQNAARILRALFEIALSRNWGPVSSVILSLCKSVDRRMWSFEHPLSQFDLPVEIIHKLENSGKNMSIEQMRDMDPMEIGNLIRHMKMGHTVAKCVDQFPSLILDATIAPITRTVIRVTLNVTPDFIWNDRVHGSVEPWYIWVEDSENTEILYSEYFLLHKRQQDEVQKLAFTIPIPRTSSTVDELPPQIFIRAVSDKWIGAEAIIPVSFKHLILPTLYRTPHTDLLDLQPLPISALQDPVLEEICRKRFDYFNPVQTQIFHTLYRTEHNVLVGAPTGSGKTVAAELALWSAFRDHPKSKVVYIAPLKALVRERVKDWRARLTGPMNCKLVELTGDVTPDLRTIQSADIIITTPEKWDGISRSWQTRSYVTAVSCVIIDEIHLLGGDRGPILEVIVSRVNYISAQTGKKIRIVGLSTALANASDLADWLGIGDIGLFNFRHSVRPVPLEIFIDGFPGKHYCPRMMSMNKPAYSAIITHSPTKPVIIFVSSRRQTRLTAQDLMALCAMEDNPKRFLCMPEEDIEAIVSQIKDQALKLSLGFGIGLHHAGLVESDRKISEELFVNGKIQILIATSTLAWGVNFPAHLVVIKGTEYYDAKVRGYVDFPITDVLQMMGRAGRPQFDDSGVAKILVHDVKKNFYKKFLHEPFPVESSLHTCLDDHLNAEIVGGTIKSKQDAVDYLTWTYLYRRLQMNPTFYGVEDASPLGINKHLSQLVEDSVAELVQSGCLEVEGDFYIQPSTFGRIGSYYYLHHKTIRLLTRRLTQDYHASATDEVGERTDGDFSQLLRILCDVAEYDELPVRHNEDGLNKELERHLPIPVHAPYRKEASKFGLGYGSTYSYEDPHVKAFLLVQAHLSRVRSLPCSDYATDTVSVLDQSIRIIQAMVDITAEQGFLATSLGIMSLMQCIKQARWLTDSTLLTLPKITEEMLPKISHRSKRIESLPELLPLKDRELADTFRRVPGLSSGDVQEICRVVGALPALQIKTRVQGAREEEDGRWWVEPGREYEIKVEMSRLRPSRGQKGQEYRIHSPRFPKPQFEGWWVVLGDVAGDNLIALKRVSPAARGSGGLGSGNDGRLATNLKFRAPEEEGDAELTLFAVSDGYLGLDQQIALRFAVRWGRIDM